MAAKVCVVGAGIIGMSTAYNVLTSLPQTDVTVIAESFYPNVTSDVAAGFWWPHVMGDTPIEDVVRWGQLTFDHLLAVERSSEAGLAGVTRVSGHIVFKEEAEIPPWHSTLIDFRVLTKEEMLQYPDYTMGMSFTTVLCESAFYMPWIMKRFEEKGGRMVQRKISDLEDLYTEYDVVINCTGLGAFSLINDNSVKPIRGQVFRVEAPWVKHFHIVEDGDTYIIPGVQYVIMGGTHQADNWSQSVSRDDSRAIWEACCAEMPSLKHAKVVKQQVGLRPSRQTIRLELEYRTHQGTTVPIIHNYGHGGGGVTLFWGCAKDAVGLVKKALRNRKSHL